MSESLSSPTPAVTAMVKSMMANEVACKIKDKANGAFWHNRTYMK
jgi:hypothetical protein